MAFLSSSMPRLSLFLYLFAGAFALLGWLMWDHFLPWQSFYNEWFAGIGILILASILFLFQWHQSARITLPLLILALVTVIPCMQYAGGLIVFFGDAALAALYLSGLALAYWTGLRLGQERREQGVTAVAGIILLGAMLSLYLESCQWLVVNKGWWVLGHTPGPKPYANLGQPNHLATLLCMGLVAALYLYETRRFGALVTGLVACSLIVGIAMTRSRTAFVIAAFIFTGVAWYGPRLALRCHWIQVLVGITLFTALWVFWPIMSQTLSEALLVLEPPLREASATPGAVITMPRLVIWAQMLDALWREPVLGYGWNQVSYAQIAVAGEHVPTLATAHSHNIVLDLFIWNGVIVGALLVLALAWWSLSRAYWCRDITTWFLLLVIGLVGIHGLLEFPLEYAYFLLPVGLCAGLVDANYQGRDRFRTLQVSGLVPAAFVLVAWVSMFYVFVDYRIMSTDYLQMRLEARGIVARKPETEPEARIFTQLEAFNRYARSRATENMSESELAWMEQVAHRYPHPPILFRYALALGLNGKYEEAELELLLLKKLHKPLRYEEGVQGWEILSERYPDLRKVSLP